MYSKRKINIIFIWSIFSIQIIYGDVVETSINIGKDNPASVLQTNSSPEVVFSSYNLGSYGNKFDANFEKQISIKEEWKSLAKNPYIYAGSYLDSESGLNLMGSRYYSTNRKRFISQDSYDFQNRYQYANSDPVSYLDPNGHSPWALISSIGSVIIPSFLFFVPGLNVGASLVLSAMPGVYPFIVEALSNDKKGMATDLIQAISGSFMIAGDNPLLFQLGRDVAKLEEADMSIGNNILKQYFNKTIESNEEYQNYKNILISRSRNRQMILGLTSQGLYGAASGISSSDGSLKEIIGYGSINATFGVLAAISYGVVSNKLAPLSTSSSIPYLDSFWKGAIANDAWKGVMTSGMVLSNVIFGKKNDAEQIIAFAGLSSLLGSISSGVEEYYKTNPQLKRSIFLRNSYFGFIQVLTQTFLCQESLNL